MSCGPCPDKKFPLGKLSIFAIALVALAAFLIACSGVSHPMVTPPGTGGKNLACSVITPGQTASLGGFVPFTGSSLWNTDISSAPVDPNSGSIITNWVGSVNMHPDWGNDPTLRNSLRCGERQSAAGERESRRVPRRERSRPDAGSRERSGGRRIVEHRRSPRAGAQQRQLLSLRTL